MTNKLFHYSLINKLIIGSRGSKLALIQSNLIKSLIEKQFIDLEIKIKVISTKGDRVIDQPIKSIGDKGLFTYEIEKQLLNHRIDVAVHSLKDLPSELNSDLEYVGSPIRQDLRDALVSTKWDCLDSIPIGGVIATGSIRRKSQLLNLRPDLKIVNLRGNVDTRILKLNESNWDGIIVAAAAMHRLKLDSLISEYLDPNFFVPAPCQGALGLEIAKDRININKILSSIINNETTFLCSVERLFLREFEGNCSIPIGCYTEIIENQIYITGYISSQDGSNSIIETINGNKNNYIILVKELVSKINKNSLRD